MTRLLSVLAIVALTASAAGAETAKEPRKAIKPAVQARAKHIAIGLRDLPGLGWHSTPSQSDRSSPHCSYYDPDQSRLTENGDYTSPDFTRVDGLYVSSSVGIFVSAGQAKTAYGLVVRPALPRCLGEQVVKSGLPGHIKLHSVAPLAFRGLGDRSAAYRIVFLVENGGRQVPAIIDLVAINKGNVDVALFFSSAGRPMAASAERKLATVVAGRI